MIDINIISGEDGFSEEDLSIVEKDINYRFPDKYRGNILKYYGGTLKIGAYVLNLWNVDDICFYVEEFDDLEGLIPFATDGCKTPLAEAS